MNAILPLIAAMCLCVAAPAATPAPAPTPAPAATPAPVLAAAGDRKEALPPGGFEIVCHGGVVTVHANEANVPELLTDFSQKSGIAFNKYIGKVERVTLDLHDSKVGDFLGRVLGSYVTKSQKKNGEVMISSVTIMDEGGENPPGSRAPPPPDSPPDRPYPSRSMDRDSPSSRERSTSLRERRLRSSRRRTPIEHRGAPEPVPPPVGQSGMEQPPPEVMQPPEGVPPPSE